MAQKTLDTPQGTIIRDGSTTLVEVFGDKSWLADYGCVLQNPDDDPATHIWRKTFKDKQVYFPDEYGVAIADHLSEPNQFVPSMNGFSSINAKQERAYGVSNAAYEEACKSIYRAVIGHLVEEFPGVNIRLVDGASDMGVDRATQAVADEMGMTALGFSCPEFLPYVQDGNGHPVFVGTDKSEYAHRYIQSLDFLVTTGGRQHALEHDLHGVFLYGKKIHVVDVLNTLSTTGGAPGRITKDDGSVIVDNAAAAIIDTLTHAGMGGVTYSDHQGVDLWPSILEHASGVAAKVCRSKMAPDLMFKKPDSYLRIVGEE